MPLQRNRATFEFPLAFYCFLEWWRDELGINTSK